MGLGQVRRVAPGCAVSTQLQRDGCEAARSSSSASPTNAPNASASDLPRARPPGRIAARPQPWCCSASSELEVEPNARSMVAWSSGESARTASRRRRRRRARATAGAGADPLLGGEERVASCLDQDPGRAATRAPDIAPERPKAFLARDGVHAFISALGERRRLPLFPSRKMYSLAAIARWRDPAALSQASQTMTADDRAQLSATPALDRAADGYRLARARARVACGRCGCSCSEPGGDPLDLGPGGDDLLASLALLRR